MLGLFAWLRRPWDRLFSSFGVRMRRFLLLLADLLLIAAATIAALAIRDNLEISLDSLRRLLPHLGLTLAAATLVILATGQHRSIWRLSAMADYARIVAAAGAIVLAATTLGFTVNRLDGVARSLPILQVILVIFALVGVRVAARQYHGWRRRGRAQLIPPRMAVADTRENVLVVGLNRVTELYLESVAEFAADRVAIAGLLGRGEQHSGRLVQSQKILGTPREIERVLQDLELHGIFVNRIVITMPFDHLTPEARDALLRVEAASDIRLDFFAERVGLPPPLTAESRQLARRVTPLDPAPATFLISDAHFKAIRQRPYWRVKRAIDFSAALALLVVMLPLMLLFGLLIAVGVGTPVAFWQVRPGLLGHPFKVLKLRTMSDAYDADRRRVPDEDRHFAVGTLLRRTRLDELPQLFNILSGEMSFVGPRPLLPIDQPEGYAARLLVRPGLTGWAQVHGGREVRAIDKAALDVWYVENASLWLDLRIIALTVPMVLFGERANKARIDQTWLDLQRAGLYDGPMPPA